MEWKNTECHYTGCADRQEQAKLRQALTSMTQERDSLYSHMENLKTALKGKDESLALIFKEMLKGVKITNQGKELTSEEIEVKIMEWSGNMDDDKVSQIVKTNLDLQKRVHDFEIQISSLKQENSAMIQKLESLEIQRKAREEKDIQLIRETQQAQGKMKDLLSEKDAIEVEVRKLSNHREAIKQDIAEARTESEEIYKRYQDAILGMKKAQEDADFYRKEFSHYQRFMPWKVSRVLSRITDCFKLIEKGRMDKARSKWITIQEKHLRLTEQEKRLIVRDYDRLMGMMETRAESLSKPTLDGMRVTLE